MLLRITAAVVIVICGYAFIHYLETREQQQDVQLSILSSIADALTNNNRDKETGDEVR